ncbi:MAG: hypothetical protein BM563_11030 [Bacteroidetes bacterium MedPE-SWsnd-G1]|nr:MAG: hypothetical protein BM563_11030 [Bacteroidetes bacterium MedPE-SWsnd-G1]
MKKIIYILLVTLSFTSCTDVIDVDVPIAEPRLVIEASIDWEKNTIGNEQLIKLSLSTPYFDENNIPMVTGADVRVINENTNDVFIFDDQNDGTYSTNTFIPILNNTYRLEVIENGETYIAHETMTSVSDIDDIYQSTENGFDEDALEVNVQYTDVANIENFYLFKFQKVGDLLPDLIDMADEFTDGNQITMFYERLEDEDINQVEFAPGDVVDIHFYGISKQYHRFMQLLISQNESGGPFSATPVALKGNCTNPNNPDNYAFGYFRCSEVVIDSYTFQ